MDEEKTHPVPKDYEQYYLQFVKVSMRRGLPVCAVVMVLFFGWDCLFVRSVPDGAKTLALRLAYAAVVLLIWRAAPYFRSLRSIQIALIAFHVGAMFTLIAILTIVPGGLTLGVPGLLLINLFASLNGMRAVPVLVGGAICTIALVTVFLASGISSRDTASQAIFFVSSIIGISLALALLDIDFKKKHRLELDLEKQKEQSEALLKEILPRYVIQRIRDGADAIAESVAEVNIIFLDIVGFSAMSRRLAPQHLVEILGDVFRSLDERCEQFGVTKIKTIGDAYMAATGAPEPASLSAVAAVEFGLEAISAVEKVAQRTGIPIQIRVGIATGAVISGVLSLKRPAYDLWGETVNLAARMENSGETNRIQIAETTYWRVKDRFHCEPRGLVDVKGFGAIQTYLISPNAVSQIGKASQAARGAF
jgi:adenylate cyclase